MDTTLCDPNNPPTASSQGQWDLMFEQSLEALCQSLNILGNIDAGAMRTYAGRTKEDGSPGTRHPGDGCRGAGLPRQWRHASENAGCHSSTGNGENLSVTSGNSYHGNRDTEREGGWRSRLEDQRTNGGDVVHHTPRFVRDTSKFWYKPHISREEAINMLKNKPPGTFVVRDSNSFPGAFGLALKVSQVPPNVQTKGGDPQAELVRHFLIEPTPKGVKLKGCSNEPVFGSLAALVYQHSITPLALPCKLVLPESDPSGSDFVDGKKDHVSSSSIMQQGAACNVLYINSADMESLTGRQAVAKAVSDSMGTEPAKCTVVHFKVSSQGITLTDNKRKLFFRRHYPINTVTYCGLDPEDRRWSKKYEDQPIPQNARLFGFVARKQGSATDNACHIFAELDPDQPAHAIVSFVSKVMAGQGHFMKS